jgi:hypothetical protein
VSYRWSWCPLPSQSGDGFKCPVDQAGFEQLLGGLMGGQAAPSLDLGMGETATFTNMFPASTLAAICNANAGATLAAGEIDGGVAGNDGGVADDASVSSEIPDGGVAEDAGGAVDDGGVDGESMAANWSAPTETPDQGAAGGIPLNKIFNCGSAGFPVTVRLDFVIANAQNLKEQPGSAVFTLYLPIDDALPGNQNPVPGVIKWASPDTENMSLAEPLDQLGSVAFIRGTKYKLFLGMAETESEGFYGWTRYTPEEAKQENKAAGGYKFVPSVEGNEHVLGDAQEILNLNWYVEGGDLGDHGGERGATSAYNPYAEALSQSPFEKMMEKQWKTPAPADYKPEMARIFVVVRDDRGGAGWTSATVTLDSGSQP